MNPSNNQLISEYNENIRLYSAFTANVVNLVQNLLSSSEIEAAIVESRTKDFENFNDKISRPEKIGKYSCLSDITDLSGIRIITYYQKDVDEVCKIIESNFSIDRSNSVDKTKEMAPDKFGYLSIHYIVSHDKTRDRLLENKKFVGMKAEIQIRTVLQHSWAVLDRKLRYNNEKDIPNQIKRRFYRISALLELADDEFSQVEENIFLLRKQYQSSISQGRLEIEINLESVELFLKDSSVVKKICDDVKSTGVHVLTSEKHFRSNTVVDALAASGINNLEELSKILNSVDQKDIEKFAIIRKKSADFSDKGNFGAYTLGGVIRLCLIIKLDKEKAEDVLKVSSFAEHVKQAIAHVVKISYNSSV